MGKAILTIEKYLIPELLYFPESIRGKFNFFEAKGSYLRPSICFTVESDLIPEIGLTPTNVPELMPVFYQRVRESGERIIELARLEVSFINPDTGGWDRTVIYEDEEIKELIERNRPTTA